MASLPSIFTFVAYDTEQNLGRFYNSAMDRLNVDDWAVFIDSDAMFVQDYWGETVQRAITEHPEFGFFTCLTNRVGCAWQRAEDVKRDEHDILIHRKYAGDVAADFDDGEPEVVEVNEDMPMSGFCMIVQKKTWKKLGGAKDGFFGVDNDLHTKLRAKGVKLGLIRSLYMYHLYKGGAEFDTLDVQP
jgi:GT2 family glycosyltransferase